MINCLTSFQKFLAALWAATGFGIVVMVWVLELAILGIMAPETVADGLGNIGFITAVIVTALYVGLSMTQCGEYEFLDKLRHAILASFLKNRQSERKVYVWMAEKQIIDTWDEYSARTRRAANFENICAFMASEFETEIEALADWRRSGASRKTLSKDQLKGVFRGIANGLEGA